MTGKFKPAPGTKPPEEPASGNTAPEETDAQRSRLEAAEWALTKLSETDGDIDTRVKALLEDAVTEVERRWAEGRERVEALVKDAEELHAIAGRQVDDAEARARDAVAVEARELLENVRRLQSQAEEKAARIIAEAGERAAQSDREMDERLAEAEGLYEKVERHIAAREEILAEVRKKADAIIRTAKATAETVKEEARVAARNTTQNAAIEAERLIQVAKEEARQHMDRVTAQEQDARERLEKARSRSAQSG
jgi:F0F1-type ATP synthase membrane subunit b/b'